MKILIVTEGFFPGKKYGGPPVSVNNLCSLVSDYEFYIVTKNHENGDRQPYQNIEDGWNDRGNCKVKYLCDEEYNSKAFEDIIDKIRPDMIYLQGLFQGCVIKCLYLAKKHGIPVLLAPRGELCKGAMRKKYKKVPYILFLRFFGLLKSVQYQSTSDEETIEIHRWLKASMYRIHLLPNVPSIPSKEYHFSEKESGKAKFVFLSRIHPKKNLVSAIRYFSGVKGEVIFDIYGPIEDEMYWEKCKSEINNLSPNVKVSYCGTVSHDMVHGIFSSYDAFLFPTFSENYGHVIVEALMVGCPVIISDQTPWNDVQESDAGWVSSLNDEAGFASAIQKVVAVDSNKYKENAKNYAQKKLDLNSLRQQYQIVIEQVLNN